MRPTIKPLKVGDLKVLKQKLDRYAPGEIAHIENVMAQERRSRRHRRLRQFEETVELEQERQEENVRDLQSTERFEMQNETEKTVKSETSFQAGLNVSASYGQVSIGASANFSTREAREESDKNSVKYAKEITEKTVNKLTERVRQLRRTRTLEEVEEINRHGFEPAPNHNVGIYRWVDKHYRAWVHNYGKRLLYEFFVPEPAAFYLFASRNHYENEVLPEQPIPPYELRFPEKSLKPQYIDRAYYLTYVGLYGAQGVEPPPPDMIVISKTITREFSNRETQFAFSEEDLDIPENYHATTADLIYSFQYLVNESIGSYHHGRYSILIGDTDGNPAFESVTPPPGFTLTRSVNSITIRNLTEKFPLSTVGNSIGAIALHITLTCKLIPEHYQRWQLNTYNAIMAAYNKSLLDYEERVAAAQIHQGVKIGGNNPLINREIEKEELKRACLTLWAGEGMDTLPGIRRNSDPSVEPPENFPTIDRASAEANITKIKFFEQAFEWKNLVYEFYPYFWGSKDVWLDFHSLQNEDPLFERFLKAGAARVVVPVRPSFTEAVLWYQLTGEIWSGGPIPSLSTSGPPTGGDDPEAELTEWYSDVESYNDYVTDMEDVEDEDGLIPEDENPREGEEIWPLRIPTTLVWLQQEENPLPDLDAGT